MVQLLINLRIDRKNFYIENYRGSDHIFALVKSGSFVYESKYGRYIAHANEGVLFRRNVSYHRQILSPVTMYFFRYQSDEPLFEDHVVFRDLERIRSTFSMLDHLDKGIFKNEFQYRTHLFMDLATQYAMENSMTAPENTKCDVLIEQAIALISELLHKKIVLSEISEKTGLSYAQFLRRFRAYTGTSPIGYVTFLRIQKAKTLLTDTDLMIREIAELCGFENEYYFSNAFKKQTGMAPSSFRKLTM